MPGLFSRLKGKDGGKSKKKNAVNDLADNIPSKPQWDDAWTRKTVEPEEIHELIRCCTEELKARGTPVLFPPMLRDVTLRYGPPYLRRGVDADAVLQPLIFLSFYCPSVRLPIRAVYEHSSGTFSTRANRRVGRLCSKRSACWSPWCVGI